MNAATKIREAESIPVAGAVPHVLIAMSNVMEEIGRTGISKDRKNAQQGYSFRGIDDVYNQLNGLMAKNRLLMLPVRMVAERTEKVSKGGGTLNYTTLTIDFKMMSAEDGTSELIQTVGEAMDSADKSSNKAQSAAMKYAALMVFMIPTEGDNDADATTHQGPSALDMAVNLLRGCGNGQMFKDAWSHNIDGWKGVLSGDELRRLGAVKAEIVARFVREAEEAKAREEAAKPKEPPTQVDPFDDEIPF